jgi:hypothetical protein
MGTSSSFPGGKARPGRDADRSPPSSAEVKKEYELYLLSPKCACMERNGTALPFYLLQLPNRKRRGTREIQVNAYLTPCKHEPDFKKSCPNSSLRVFVLYICCIHKEHNNRHAFNKFQLQIFSREILQADNFLNVTFPCKNIAHLSHMLFYIRK